MNKKIILGSLAMDLKRAAIGYHRGSNAMGDRFLREAIARKNEYKGNDLEPYVMRILAAVEDLQTLSEERRAEDALMYCTLIQNFVMQKGG